MAIIDSQVHVYEATRRNGPGASVPNWPDHVTGDEMVTAMDKVGVDGTIFISAFTVYRYDASHAVEVQRDHPGRLSLVETGPTRMTRRWPTSLPDWKKTPGTVGIRIMMTREAGRDPTDPGLDRILRAAVQHRFPGRRAVLGNVEAGHEALIDRHPETRFVIDHLASPPRRPLHHRSPGRLPKVLDRQAPTW